MPLATCSRPFREQGAPFANKPPPHTANLNSCGALWGVERPACLDPIVCVLRSSVVEQIFLPAPNAALELSTIARRADMGPRPHLKTRTLLAQVLAVNLLLIAATALLATLVVDFHLATFYRGRELLVLGVALIATLGGNWLLLRRRFMTLEEVISLMETTDSAAVPCPSQRSNARGSRTSASARTASGSPCSGWACS